MLACNTRRQHHPHYSSTSSSSICNPPYLSSPPTIVQPLPHQHSHQRSYSQPVNLAIHSNLPHIFTGTTPSTYNFAFNSALSANPAIVSPSPANSQLMPGQTYNFGGPAYTFQAPSFPQPQLSSSPAENSGYPSYLTGNPFNTSMVANFNPAMQSNGLNRGIKRPHHRALSASSSIASNRPRSPYSQPQATSMPFSQDPSSSPATHINTLPASSKFNAQGQTYTMDAAGRYSHNLPTPTQTPTQESFISSQYPQMSSPHDNATMATIMMNKAMDHPCISGDDDVPGMSRSGRHSVSSVGQQEPVTPHTVTDSYDDGFKVPTHDVIPRHTVPKFDRTYSDILQDECYIPASTAPMPAAMKAPQSNYLSPLRNDKVTQALQAAQLARSHTPLSDYARGISPFRPDSPYVKDTTPMRSAAQVRQQQKDQNASNELNRHIESQQRQQQPTTISPKDAMLDYRDDDDNSSAANVSLFPSSNSTASFGDQYGQQAFSATPASAAQFNFNSVNNSRNSWNDVARQQFPVTQAQVQPFSLAVPSGASSTNGYNVLPFNAVQGYRNMKSEENPIFPATLTSMESSASDAPTSSAGSSIPQISPAASIKTANLGMPSLLTKPDVSTRADTGTYTCTYHGCAQRFENPQKLQKHKREVHHAVASLMSGSGSGGGGAVGVLEPGQAQEHTLGVGSGMTSAALAARNSQQGPHKCDRINPTTGKLCNSIFSRPYDLTRHEDTIHNCKKQKVRCALCVEEKTFSRNDALTRHMRVVHPEVDFPGKHRRRGDP